MDKHQELKKKICKVVKYIMAMQENDSDQNKLIKGFYVSDLIDMETVEDTGFNVRFLLNRKLCYSLSWLKVLSEVFCSGICLVRCEKGRMVVDIQISHENAENIK